MNNEKIRKMAVMLFMEYFGYIPGTLDMPKLQAIAEDVQYAWDNLDRKYGEKEA